jgi:hypothetical protein
MKREKLLKGLLLSWMLLFFLRGKSQDFFAYEAPLDTVGQAGFYKVILTPDAVAKCKRDLADLRILDAHGQVTPYVLRSDLPIRTGESFSEFPILPAKAGADSSNEVQIANWSSGSIHSLLLYVHNFTVRRNFTLSGSDDRQKWFAIKEHILWEPSNDDSTEYFIQRIDFPASNYHYFKIIQEEKGVLPVNILRAGIATEHVAGGSYRPTPAPQILQKDSSDHHSYVTLIYGEPFLIDKLELDVVGPRLYKRKARIFSKEDPYAPVSLDIDPIHHTFLLPSFKTRVLILDIDNEDNAPLVVNNIVTSQLERYLLVWLQPGIAYRLLAGNVNASAPAYDLKYFVDSVRREPGEILPGALQAVVTPTALPMKNKNRSGVLLWVIISAVLVLLIYLSFRMLKAIPGNHQKEDNQ